MIQSLSFRFANLSVGAGNENLPTTVIYSTSKSQYSYPNNYVTSSSSYMTDNSAVSSGIAIDGHNFVSFRFSMQTMWILISCTR